VINKQKVKAEDIKAKFDECVSASNSGTTGVLDMQSLIRVSIDSYEKGQRFNIGQGLEIKNALRYMQACIWQALLVGLADPQVAARVRNKELSDIIPLASGQYQRDNDFTSTKRNRFCNFEERNYDYAELERLELELLKKSMEK